MNFVQKTLLASYDSLTGNITLVRDSKCLVDESPEKNTYRKVLANSKLPNVLEAYYSTAEETSSSAANYALNNDNIDILEVEESEVMEHFHCNDKLPSF